MAMYSYSKRPRNLAYLLLAGLVLLLTTASLIVEFSSARTKHTLCTAVFPDTSQTRKSYVFNSTAPRSRTVNPRALISAVAQGQNLSARFVHQSWKTHTLLPHVVPLADSWRLAYPNWDYVLWDDADNKELVRVLYPRLLEAYEALPSEIYRADFARNLYM
jgi:mannosyltransferase OCH1-like enzyme